MELGGEQFFVEAALHDRAPVNWMIPGKMGPGMGGAMDLVIGAKRVIVGMQHTIKGKAKIVKQCSLPLKSLRPIDLLIMEMEVVAFSAGRTTLLETAHGVSMRDVLNATETAIVVPNVVLNMSIEGISS